MKISAKLALELLLAAAVLCMGAAALYYARTPDESIAVSAASVETDPISTFRTERQQLRAMQKAQLNDIAHDASADASTADMARRRLIEICESEEQELTIEGVLSMRGFSDPVVTVHGTSVNVLIKSEGVTRQESSVILDLVSRETGALAGDIKIIPIN